MKNPYYMIWADALWASKRKKVPVFFAFLIIAMAQYTNIITLLLIFSEFDIHIRINPDFSYFQNEKRNYLVIVIFYYYLPLIIVNYLLAYWRGKNKELMKKYKSRGARLFLSYFIISMFLFFVVVGIIEFF